MAMARLSTPVSSTKRTASAGIGVDDGGGAVLGLAVRLADRAELALDRQAHGVRGVDDLLGDRDVLVERQHRAVDHDGGEAALDREQDLLVGRAVVEVDGHRHGRAMGSLGHRGDHVDADVAQLVGMDGDDDRGVLLLADVHDTVQHRVVADVERGDREACLVGDPQQVDAVHEHDLNSPCVISSVVWVRKSVSSLLIRRSFRR